jgi:hypothetical protein
MLVIFFWFIFSTREELKEVKCILQYHPVIQIVYQMYTIFQLVDPGNNIIFPVLSGYLYI